MEPGPLPATRTFLIAAVIIGGLLRTAWSMHHGLAIDIEGVEYARIAENLLAGRGYVGMFNNGTQLNFPPLYPILIAAGTLVCRNSELAARAVNIICGALLVLPMFGIARRLYGERVARTVAVLAVCHPVLIGGGASTFAEGPYLTLLMTGLYWLVVWIDDQQVRASAAAGAFLGLAYLVRPEAFVLTGVFGLCALTAALLAKPRGPLLRGAIILGVAFFVVALPNIIFLTKSTGKIRIEAKGTLGYQWGSRMNAGMSYVESVNGIGEDLSEQGVFMKPNLEVINAPGPTTRQYLAFLLTAAHRNVRALIDVVVSERGFGSPVLFGLMILGLFRSSWDRRRLVRDGLLALTVGLILFTLLAVQALWFRYFYSLLGVFLIWGGKGADEMLEWGRSSIAAMTGSDRAGGYGGRLLKWGLIAAVLLLAARELPTQAQFNESLYTQRVKAGRWIREQAGARSWVMDSGIQVAYYAGADALYLPYARADLALQYVAKKKPDYIVLHSFGKSDYPYTAQWFDEGIPDKRASLVYSEGAAPGEQIKIFKWVDATP